MSPEQVNGANGVSSPGNPVEEIESEIKDIVAVVEDLQYELDHARQINEALQEAVQTAGAREKELRTLVESQTETIEKQKRLIADKDRECQTLMANLSASDEERSEAAKEIRQLTLELELREKELHKRSSEIRSLEDQMASLRQEAAHRENSLKSEIRLLEEKQSDLRNKLETRDREYYDMKAKADELNSHNQQLQKDIKDLERSRAALENSRSKMKGFRDRTLTGSLSVPPGPGPSNDPHGGDRGST